MLIYRKFVAAGIFGVLHTGIAAAQFPPSVALPNLDGTDGFRLNATPGDFAGEGITDGCDLNADGRDDGVVEALLADTALLTDAGKAYIVFDRPDTNPFAASIAAATTFRFPPIGSLPMSFSSSTHSAAGRWKSSAGAWANPGRYTWLHF